MLGAGAADVLLKSASMLPEGPVVLCGNGPLILQTVVHLKHFGIPIAGVALTGSPASLFKAALRMPGALLRPQYLLHGMGMGLRTFFGAPCHPAANDISIRRDGETLTVDFTSFGKRKSLQGTAVLLHEGVVPETRITPPCPAAAMRRTPASATGTPRRTYGARPTSAASGSRATARACAEPTPPSPAARPWPSTSAASSAR